jgi:hypothetical protein
VAAAYTAFDQIAVAKRQNEIADRQALGVIVASITEERRALEGTHGTRRLVIEEALIADAEEALTLVEAQAKPVPAVDNYEIGEAFEESGSTDYHSALTSFRRSAQVKTDPRYRAASLRGEAHILYQLGGSTNAEQARAALAAAYHSYDGQPDMTNETIAYYHAYTDLFAVVNETPIDCTRARKQLDYAKELIRTGQATSNTYMVLELKFAEHNAARCR